MSYRPRGIDGQQLLDYIKQNCTMTSGDCWIWEGAVNDRGYGTIKYKGKTWRVHRLTAFLFGNGLPDEWDHTCRNQLCCNPKHLEDVEHVENVRRGELKGVSKNRYTKVTHCPSGHPYSGTNLYVDPKGCRRCRECGRLSKARNRI